MGMLHPNNVLGVVKERDGSGRGHLAQCPTSFVSSWLIGSMRISIVGYVLGREVGLCRMKGLVIMNRGKAFE